MIERKKESGYPSKKYPEKLLFQVQIVQILRLLEKWLLH